MVAHGGWHNDTICTIENKIKENNKGKDYDKN